MSNVKIKFDLAKEEAAVASSGNAAFKALAGKPGVIFTVIEPWTKDIDGVKYDRCSKKGPDGKLIHGEGALGCYISVNGERMWMNLSQIIVAANKVAAVKKEFITSKGEWIISNKALIADFDKDGKLISIGLAEAKSA